MLVLDLSIIDKNKFQKSAASYNAEDSMNLLKSFLAVFLPLILAGCAAHTMALKKGQTEIDVKKKSIALLTIKTANEYSPDRQFDLAGVVVCPQSETCSNVRPYFHKANSAYKYQENHHNEYLLSLELEPGEYYLHSAALVYVKIATEAGGYTPLNLKMQIRPNAISYLGHIDITLRKKKEKNEATAGREVINMAVLSVELKEKSIVGFSAGAIDILVGDKFTEDMNYFSSEYPALRNALVDKNILPQWVRPENRNTK